MRTTAICLSLAFFLSCIMSLPVTLPTACGGASIVATAHAKKSKTVSVRSYKKKSGTRVKAHKRSKGR